jgi:secreted trypsin-like serine protease
MISSSVCNPSWTTVLPTQICSDNADSGVCVGDEGGPLVIVRNGRYIQVGIIQVLYANQVLQACRTGNKVYTRITSYLDWIEANM